MEISFKGQRALVTGAAQGIGKEIAIKLVNCGATVIALDLSQKLLEDFKKEFPSIITVVTDLTDWKGTENSLKSLLPINLLVNNAGFASIGPLTEVTEDIYNLMFNINVKGVINVTKSVIGQMADAGFGSIVNISSQASQAALLHHTVYCASKGAIDAFTRATALEFGSKGVRINCVNPTVVMTELGRAVWSDTKMREDMLSKIPLNRFAEIENVVDAVLYLLSDKASMITGSCLAVDGGFLAC